MGDLVDHNLQTLLKDLQPFADKPVGSIRIDMNDVRSVLTQAAEIEKLRRENEQLQEARFLPLGDNHHNAVLCPYCNPDRIDPAAERSRAEKAERERDGYQWHLRQCEQIAGKALGYPWYKDDQKNFPGATEADGVCIGEHVGDTIVDELATRATALEEQVAALQERYENWKPISEPPHEQRIHEGALMAFYMPSSSDDDEDSMGTGTWDERSANATMWCQITQPAWPRALSDPRPDGGP